MLLDMVFGPLINGQGIRRAGDRISIDYKPPLLRRLNPFSPGYVPGYVWLEDGLIVGNVSLIQSQLQGRYLIANVAVHPDYRRKGIARGLMEIAMEHVRLRKGREIFLQVRDENGSAVNLYRRLGFKAVGSVKNWYTSTSRLKLSHTDQSAGDIRPLRRSEWRTALNLDFLSVDPDLTWPSPAQSDKYDRSLVNRIETFINGSRQEIWIKEIEFGEERRSIMAGLVNLWSNWGRAMKLELRVHPATKGTIERELLTKGLLRLRNWKDGNIRIRHPAGDDYTNQLLSEMNFKESHSLLVMKHLLQ